MIKWRMLDLFSGVGGFSLAAKWVWGDDLEIIAHSEINKQCAEVLRIHFPEVPNLGDITKFMGWSIEPIDLICGGDPCPIRSRARSIWGTKYPDLSGYFLAVVGRCKPRWVVRENVLASDDKDFEAALDAIGYRCVIIRADGISFTGQIRQRDFIVGSLNPAWPSIAASLPIFEHGKGSYTEKLKKGSYITALTSHGRRYDSRDCFIWEKEGIRLLDNKERLRFAGFPENWLDGLSETAICRMTGNAVIPQIAEQIFRAIKEVEEKDWRFGGIENNEPGWGSVASPQESDGNDVRVRIITCPPEPNSPPLWWKHRGSRWEAYRWRADIADGYKPSALTARGGEKKE